MRKPIPPVSVSPPMPVSPNVPPVRREAVRGRRAVDVLPQRPALGARDRGARDRPPRARISRRSTTSAPSATAWPATQWPPPRIAIGSPALRAARTAADHVGRRPTLNDRRRPPIDRPVEGLSGVVVAVVVRPDHGPGDPIETCQRIDGRHARHDAPFPIGVNRWCACRKHATWIEQVYVSHRPVRASRSHRPSRPVPCTAVQSPRSQARRADPPDAPRSGRPSRSDPRPSSNSSPPRSARRSSRPSPTTGGHLGSLARASSS